MAKISYPRGVRVTLPVKSTVPQVPVEPVVYAYNLTAADYVAACGSGATGPVLTRTSTVSVAEAKRLALAALVCPVPTSTARVTGYLPYDGHLAYDLSTLDSNRLRSLFDPASTQPPFPDYETWLGPTNKFYFRFQPEDDVRLQAVVFELPVSATGSSGNTPFTVGYYDVARQQEVVLGTYTAVAQQPATFTVSGGGAKADYVYCVVTGSKATFPSRVRFVADYVPGYVRPPFVRPVMAWAVDIGADWYNEQDPSQLPSNGVTRVDAQGRPAFYSAVAKFSGTREYGPVTDYFLDVDRREVSNAVFVTDPPVLRTAIAYNGGHNLDARLAQAKLAGKPKLVSFIDNFIENQRTWPSADYGKNSVTAYGADELDPRSYGRWVAFAAQIAAKFGPLTFPAAQLRQTTNKLKYYHPQEYNQILSGLNTMTEAEWGNEWNKSWKESGVYLNPEAMATCDSAIFDADQGRLNVPGQLMGFVSTCPSLTYWSSGRYYPSAGEIRAYATYALKIRGRKANGKIDLPTHGISFHGYDDLNGKAVPYALHPSRPAYEELVRYCQELDLKVRQTEFGGSLLPGGTYVRVDPTPQRNLGQRQADLNLHHSQMMLRLGVRPTVYRLSSGAGAVWDERCGVDGLPTQAYVAQLDAELQGYLLTEVVGNPELDPAKVFIDKYTKAGAPDQYLVHCVSDGQDKTLPFTLPLPGQTAVTIVTLQDTGVTPVRATAAVTNGSYAGTATEKMTLYVAGTAGTAPAPPAPPAPSESAAFTVATTTP